MRAGVCWCVLVHACRPAAWLARDRVCHHPPFVDGPQHGLHEAGCGAIHLTANGHGGALPTLSSVSLVDPFKISALHRPLPALQAESPRAGQPAAGEPPGSGDGTRGRSPRPWPAASRCPAATTAAAGGGECGCWRSADGRRQPRQAAQAAGRGQPLASSVTAERCCRRRRRCWRWWCLWWRPQVPLQAACALTAGCTAQSPVAPVYSSAPAQPGGQAAAAHCCACAPQPCSGCTGGGGARQHPRCWRRCGASAWGGPAGQHGSHYSCGRCRVPQEAQRAG